MPRACNLYLFWFRKSHPPPPSMRTKGLQAAWKVAQECGSCRARGFMQKALKYVHAWANADVALANARCVSTAAYGSCCMQNSALQQDFINDQLQENEI
eukprot:366431-Chlamydomonas_euryale.AAC.19